MAVESPPAVPRQIGRFDLLAKIAEGGMGAVYKARDPDTGDTVAIKVVPAETAKNPVLLKRFEQEFQAASRFDHPNIVKAIFYCGTGPSPFLVMEYVDGRSLGQAVEQDGAMPEADAVRVIAQVCDGLHRAHKQGLIHRDVKPDNVLLTAAGVAKLTDMGLVKDVEGGDLNLTKTGRGLGTPHFMAPEQFRDAKNADVRCDVYSLGATLYMLVTGQVPFARTSPLDCWMKKIANDFPAPRALAPRLSERVDRAIRNAMSAAPAARPASCREFVEDLTGKPWRSESGPVPPPAGDLWYLAYKDAAGQQRTVKGTTETVEQNLKAGALGDPKGVLVSRTKAGPFVSVRSVPEFRVWATSPQPMPAGGKSGGTSTKLKPPSPATATDAGGRTSPRTAPPGRRAPAVIPDNTPAAGDIDPTDPVKVVPLRGPNAAPAKAKWWPWAVVGSAAVAALIAAGVRLLR